MNTITIKEQVLFNRIEELIAAKADDWWGVNFNDKQIFKNEIFENLIEVLRRNLKYCDEINYDSKTKIWTFKIEDELDFNFDDEEIEVGLIIAIIDFKNDTYYLMFDKEGSLILKCK